MESIFKANPKVDVFFVCEDGNVFIKEQEAKNYCSTTNGKYARVERGEAKAEKAEDKKVEAVEAVKEVPKEEEPKKEVKKTRKKPVKKADKNKPKK